MCDNRLGNWVERRGGLGEGAWPGWGWGGQEGNGVCAKAQVCTCHKVFERDVSVTSVSEA